MAGAHQAILEEVQGWLKQGRRVWLCTITETWGSSPRPVGSWLAVSDTGEWSGSVSGGCLEQDLLERCVRESPQRPQLREYGITTADRDRFQLPCGGRIQLLVEPLFPERDLIHVGEVLDALSARRAVIRRVNLSSGRVELGNGHVREAGVRVEDEIVHQYLAPEFRLLLVGAGEVAHYVAEFASAADFSVTLCEPRSTFSEGWRSSWAPLVKALPDDLVGESFNDARAGVLALAHDPRVDDLALLAALQSDAFYIGAMGSLRTSASRRERLISLGVTEHQLGRLRAPIGINIPSKTPAEIAISVVADLIAERHHLRAAAPAL